MHPREFSDRLDVLIATLSCGDRYRFTHHAHRGRVQRTRLLKVSYSVRWGEDEYHKLMKKSNDTLTTSIEITVDPNWSDREIKGAALFGVMWVTCHEAQELFCVDGVPFYEPHEHGNIATHLLFGQSGSLGQFNLSDLGKASRKFFILEES